MAAVTIYSDFGAPQNSLTLFPLFPHLFAMGADTMIFVFWMLSFKATFSLSSFTFIKKRFSSSSLSAIRVAEIPYYVLIYDICYQHKSYSNFSLQTLIVSSFEKISNSLSPLSHLSLYSPNPSCLFPWFICAPKVKIKAYWFGYHCLGLGRLCWFSFTFECSLISEWSLGNF